jgi:hypothetical protein
MAITVGTNSYVTELELTTYASDRGITITGDESILLIRSMDYIETRIYKSTKLVDTQPLQFPRYDYNPVPNEIKNAQMIGAILIGQGYDLQAPIEQAIKSERVEGVVTVEYQDGSNSSVLYTALNDVLCPFTSSALRGVRI